MPKKATVFNGCQLRFKCSVQRNAGLARCLAACGCAGFHRTDASIPYSGVPPHVSAAYSPVTTSYIAGAPLFSTG